MSNPSLSTTLRRCLLPTAMLLAAALSCAACGGGGGVVDTGSSSAGSSSTSSGSGSTGGTSGAGSVSAELADISVLMLGNSHTEMNDLPFRLQTMLRAGRPGKTVAVVPTIATVAISGNISRGKWLRGGSRRGEIEVGNA